jgi:hypothetical protein
MAGCAVKSSRKTLCLFLLAVCALVLGACFVPPELKYRSAIQKYKPGTTAEAIEHDYGVHLDLRPSGNILGYTPTDEERRRHPAYEAFLPEEYVNVAFNADHEVIYTTKLTPLRALQKFVGL